MSLNERAWRILEDVSGRVSRLEFGDSVVLDFGVEEALSESAAKEVALRVSEACLGGLGRVSSDGKELTVSITEMPALACLGSQMSGWAVGVGGKTALGSGPARVLARKPRSVFGRIGYSEESEKAVLCLETEALPSKADCEKILEKTGASRLLVAAYRPDSAVGILNVLARVAEMGVFRLDFLGYDTLKIVQAKGVVPVPNLTGDVMSDANDAIIYGGYVELKVSEWDDNLTPECVSTSSRFYGKSFSEVFAESGGDFYKIDNSFFAPAEVTVCDESSGRVYRAGKRTWPTLK